MPDSWPVARKILIIKGDMSYRDLEKDIIRKTGKRLAFITLRQIACGLSAGSPKAITILAEYAGKPISWFYEEETIPEASVNYLTPTGDSLKDEIRRTLYELLEADNEVSTENLRLLAEISEHIARDEHKARKKKRK